MAQPVETLVPVRAPSASFTRPSDTTQYASGDLVANSTSAGSVLAMQFNIGAPTNDATVKFFIVAARLHATKATITAASFRLHLYTATPTFTSSGDNGVYGTVVATGNANWIASFDFVLEALHADGAAGVGTPTSGVITPQILTGRTPGSDSYLYGLLEARDTYTPSSAEVFTVRLLVEGNQ